MARLTQREGAWKYETPPGGPADPTNGFEPFSQVAGFPTFLERLYVNTISQPVADPPVIPFWILIFDTSTGDRSSPNGQIVPADGSKARFTSPPILVAGAVFIFEPPIKAYNTQDGEQLFQGEPFDSGILVVPSSTPIVLTKIQLPPGVGGLISSTARGTSPRELREKERPRSSTLETKG